MLTSRAFKCAQCIYVQRGGQAVTSGPRQVWRSLPSAQRIAIQVQAPEEGPAAADRRRLSAAMAGWAAPLHTEDSDLLECACESLDVRDVTSGDQRLGVVESGCHNESIDRVR